MKHIRSLKKSPAIELPEKVYDRIYDAWLNYILKRYGPWDIRGLPEFQEHFLMFGIPIVKKEDE